MTKFIKQLFCNHKYNYLGHLKYYFVWDDGTRTVIPTKFLECSKCGKRKIIRDDKFYYKETQLKIFKLWLKGQIELEMDDTND